MNYSFDIDLYDDAEFKITGVWDNKPIEYMYDRQALEDELSGISSVAADNNAVQAIVNGREIIVLNAGAAPVSLYDLNGRVVMSGTAAEVLDASACMAGVYVLTVDNKAIKVVLK